jgi:hypothetical protein
MDFIGGRVNRFARTWWENSLAYFNTLVLGAHQRFYLLGHSWGSTYATLAAEFIKEHRPASAVSLLTFGSPKFCDRDTYGAAQWTEFARVMNFGDLTPYLVPWPEEAPLFAAAHTPNAILNLNSTAYMANGIRIKSGFAPTDAVTPAGFSLPLELNIPQFIEFMRGGMEPHFMTTYVNVLAELETNPPGGPAFNHQAAEPHALADWEPLSFEEVLELVDQVYADATTLIKVTPNPSPDATRIRAVRFKKRHFVTIDGKLVYRASGRRDAVAVARALRRYGEQLRQNVKGFTNPTALNYQLQGAIPFSDGDPAQAQ